MIRVGTIGTSWICEEFIKAAEKINNIKVRACYSRNILKAKEFIEKNNIKSKPVSTFEDLADEVEAIYIASPNGLHYEQAKYFLSQQKHVFLEKPLTLKFEHAKELYQIAKINNVILMEAFKPIHTPQYKLLDDFVEKYNPVLNNFILNKYSSRMNDVKNGIYESVFDQKLGKGSTYDMLVYPVELSIALFGPVEELKSIGIKLPNGSGLTDIVNIRHKNGELTNIVCSKGLNSYSPSEIISENATISFEGLTNLNKISFCSKIGIKEIFNEQNVDAFLYETNVFANMIENNDYELRDHLLNISCETVRVLNLIEESQNKMGEK